MKPKKRVRTFFYPFNKASEPTNLSKDQVPNRKIDNSDSIIAWEVQGADLNNRNNFPQQLLQTVYNSPVGSSALDIWQEFVEGDGFVDPECGKIVINKDGETLQHLHAKISADLSYLWGFAVHISYNARGEKTELNHLPFESTRLGLIDKKGDVTDIRFNPYFGIPQDKHTVETTVYYTYEPDPVKVVQQMKEHAELKRKGKVNFNYPGQAFWFSIERPLARIYPQPFYYSSINWFKIDAEIQKFHERNIDNNFLLSVIINMQGNPDAPAGPETVDTDNPDQFETVGEQFNDQMINHFSGAQNGGVALVNWFMTELEKADIKAFPTNSHHDLFIALQNITTDQICIGTKTPPILLSIKTAGTLGDSQEIVNAVMVMQARTQRMRNILAEQYGKLMTGFPKNTCEDFSIKNLNPFNILPDWAIATLTTEEKRTYINENFSIELDIAEPLPGAVPGTEEDPLPINEAFQNLTGRQFENIRRIVRKFDKEEITYGQAEQMLKDGYAMSDENIIVWLGEDEEIVELAEL